MYLELAVNLFNKVVRRKQEDLLKDLSLIDPSKMPPKEDTPSRSTDKEISMGTAKETSGDALRKLEGKEGKRESTKKNWQR